MQIDLEKIVQSDQEHLIHPLFHPNDQKDPFVWVKGEGATLWAADGRQFIDGLSCLWNVNVGHGRKELGQVAARQMEQLAFASGYAGNTNIPAVQLGERMAAICYPSINHFFFTSGGGESNDSAIKTARFFWISQGKKDKTKIISRENGYHGVTIGSMSATGIPAYWPMFGGRLPGFLSIPALDADALEKAIVNEGSIRLLHSSQSLSRVRADSAAICGLLRIREICNKYDVLFIADEIITGFPRTGKWFALDHWKIEPTSFRSPRESRPRISPRRIGITDRVFSACRGAARTAMMCLHLPSHPGVRRRAANIDIIEREGRSRDAKGARLLKGLQQLASLMLWVKSAA